MPGTTDAGDVFALANGKLSVTSNSSAAAGYRLENGTLKIDGAANEQIEATANFVRCTTAKTISFSYDHNGLRTQKKIVEGSTTTVYDYTLHGKLITHLTKTVNGTKSAEMHFFYDALGRPAMVKHGNNLYRYVHNLQGNIVGIIDDAGTLVVEYKYDAWGNLLSDTGGLSSTLGKLNPYRFRCYPWDEEIEFYFLRSRVYSPKIGRFVNADVVIIHSILGKNVFCYCWNGSSNYIDSSGSFALSTIFSAAGALINGAANFVGSIASDLAMGRKVDLGKAAKEGLKGAISGAFKPWILSSVVTFAVDTIAYVIECHQEKKEVEGSEIVWSALSALAFGVIGEGIKDGKQVSRTAETILDVIYATGSSTASISINRNLEDEAKARREQGKTSTASSVWDMPYLAVRKNENNGKYEEYIMYPTP